MFVKLFNQILDSSIADNRRLRHFFTDLLLCSDPQGFVFMTEAAISRRIGTTLDEVLWGIAELEKPDPRSKTQDHEGRRIEKLDGSGYGWRIINFEAYKMMRSADDMREKTKERVRKFRETKKLDMCNVTVTLGNACNTTKRKRNTKMNTENNNIKESGDLATLEEVKAFAIEIGLKESDGESTYHKWAANEWTNGKSRIKNWKATMRSWKAASYMPSQRAELAANNNSKPIAKKFSGMQEQLEMPDA